MELTAFRKLSRIIQVINLSYGNLNKDQFRREVLHTIAKVFRVNKAIFALQNEEGGFPDLIHLNVDELFQRKYINYYYREDPFGIITGEPPNCRISLGPLHEKVAVSLRELPSAASLYSSDYFKYCLRPMNVGHEVNIYLKSKYKLQGYIGLFRNEKAEDFSPEDLELMKIISSYITIALENIDLRAKSELAISVANTIGEHHPYGLILCNEAVKPVYMNRKAESYCKAVSDSDASPGNTFYPIPEVLLKDCRHLNEKSKRGAGLIADMPKTRTVESKGGMYCVNTRLLEDQRNAGKRRAFIVWMEKIYRKGYLNEEKVQRFFQLTNRETEIVSCIFKGLKNSEIGEQLFISEKTVKRHIQNISQKIGTRNRTEIIHKIFSNLYMERHQSVRGVTIAPPDE